MNSYNMYAVDGRRGEHEAATEVSRYSQQRSSFAKVKSFYNDGDRHKGNQKGQGRSEPYPS